MQLPERRLITLHVHLSLPPDSFSEDQGSLLAIPFCDVSPSRGFVR